MGASFVELIYLFFFLLYWVDVLLFVMFYLYFVLLLVCGFFYCLSVRWLNLDSRNKMRGFLSCQALGHIRDDLGGVTLILDIGLQSFFSILVWTPPYQASGNLFYSWVWNSFCLRKKKKKRTKPHPPAHTSLLLISQLSKGLVDYSEEEAAGAVCRICDSLLPIWGGTQYESNKGGLSHFPDTLGVLIMVAHQCLITSLLHCIWCCIADVFGCTFFIIKMYKTYIVK